MGVRILDTHAEPDNSRAERAGSNNCAGFRRRDRRGDHDSKAGVCKFTIAGRKCTGNVRNVR